MSKASAVRETSRLPMGKGCQMIFKVDDSVPKDSIHHHWAETSYDGQPESWCPVIGSHWHKYHDEYMQVIQGRMSFTLENTTVELGPSDPPFHISKLHVHSFRFLPGVPATFTEKTDPPGSYKEAFFETLLEGGHINFLSVMRSFYDGDTYLALPGGIRAVDEWVTWGLGKVGKWWYPKAPPAVPSDAMSKESIKSGS